MKHFIRLKKTFFVLAAIFLSLSYSYGQTSIATLGVPVTQNFNSLTPAGNWTDANTLSNWYALKNTSTVPSPLSYSIPTSFALNDGSINTANFYSFGNTSDRAIGMLNNGSVNGQMSYVGWRLKNTTGASIRTLRVSWVGEQWSQTALGSATQFIKLSFKRSVSVSTDLKSSFSGTTSQFQTLHYLPAATSVLDGNAAVNRSTNVYIFENIFLAPGEEIMLRWDFTKASNAHSLAIDDVSVTAVIDQSIDFEVIPDKTFGDNSFTLNATSVQSLGLPITYEIDKPSIATISGNTVTIVGSGVAQITARQAGTEVYSSASTVSLLNVYPSVPVLSQATDISTTSFKANWDAVNGLNGSSINYSIGYTVDPTFNVGPISTPAETPNKYITCSPLSPSTVYYYRVYSQIDGLYSAYSESAAITTGTDYTSAADGDWDTADKWVTNESPLGVANTVTILHNINSPNTARASNFVNSLVIKPTGKLNNAEVLNVFNQLVIESDVNENSGQILNSSTINVGSNAKIIVRKSFTGGKWYFVGFPFQVASTSIYLANTTTPATWGDLGASGVDFIAQEYNGANRDLTGNYNNSGSGVQWINVPGKVFTAKKGYIVYCPSNITLDFVTTGSKKLDMVALSSNVAASLYTTNGNQAHNSWNLIANPFVTSYDLYSSPAQAPYYVYDGITYQSVMRYDHYVVKPFISFFLQATANSVGFANGGRKLGAPAVNEDELPFDEIKLAITDKNYSDYTRIRLEEGASANYVVGSDAAKIVTLNASVPQIYSVSNGNTFSVNTLPKTTTSVELYNKVATVGSMTISLQDAINAPNCEKVILLDKATNVQTDLMQNSSYTFNASAIGTFNRFKITVVYKTSDVTTAIDSNTNSQVNLRIVNDNALLTGLTGLATVKVYDVVGRLVSNNINVDNEEPIYISNKGVYLFEISTENKTYRIKSINK